MKSSFCIDLQRFMLIPTKFPLSHNETEKQVPLREPDLMIVMTGGSMAYTRPDGVKVIPLACLKD